MRSATPDSLAMLGAIRRASSRLRNLANVGKLLAVVVARGDDAEDRLHQ